MPGACRGACGGRSEALRPTRPILPAMRRLIAFVVLATLFASCGGSAAAAPDRPVRILSGEPTTLDPAAQGDAGSAAITAQLFESLTAFDANLQVRPALAASWEFADGGRQVTFHLRPDLTFSDGSPLRPSDVVRSWLRLIDPAHPSPLASIALDIAGADAYLRGTSHDAATVGLHADDATRRPRRGPRPAGHRLRQHRGRTELRDRPARGRQRPGERARARAGFVASGGYTLASTTPEGLELKANPRYWAGPPAVTTIDLIADLGGKGPVDAFAAGDLDYAPVAGIDATWLAYDKTLGPQLRLVDSLSVQYYGFDTRQKPFDDARVRQAFGEAVDWRRMAALSGSGGTAQVANSMVPPGIPGRSDADFVPKYDPADARRLLAEAGYPGGSRLPGHDPDDRWVRLRRGDRHRAQARARRHPPGRDHGRRLLRPAGDGPAGDVVAGLGRRLSRPQRLPRRPARPATRPTTTATGRRPRSTRRSARPSRRPTRRRRRGLRSGGGDRARRRAGRAGRLRAGLGADPNGPAGRRSERARHRPDGGAGMGDSDAPPAAAARRRRAAAGSRPERGGRRAGDVRDADGRLDLRQGDRVPPAGDGLGRRSDAWSCC